MLAAEHYPYRGVAMPNHELLEVHRSKISIHHAKVGYDYPAIRPPFTFSGLIGLPTRIYQTVHNGGLPSLLLFLPLTKRRRKANKSENTKLPVKSARLDIAADLKSNKD
jgi:hypothetical protein